MTQRERLRTALDRAYYAMHYSAQALLIHFGVRPPKSHRGLISLFGKEVVAKGIVDRTTGRSLTQAFELRQKGTYSIDIDFDKEQVENIVKKAEQFIEEAQRVIGYVR